MRPPAQLEPIEIHPRVSAFTSQAGCGHLSARAPGGFSGLETMDGRQAGSGRRQIEKRGQGLGCSEER